MAISVSDLEQRVQRGDDLSGIDLREMDLSGAKLAGARLRRADLAGAKLEGADLSDAQLSRANLSEAFALRAILVNANLDKADLDDCVLRQANLTKANLQRACLDGANLEEARLDGATLAYAQLDSANLTSADLKGADLRGADLSYACLALAHLEGARVERANLSHAVLDGASLAGADFSGSALEATSLEGADLQRASFGGFEGETSPLEARSQASSADRKLQGADGQGGDPYKRAGSERYFGPGDLLRNAELHFEPAAVVRVDGRFESCSLHLSQGARLVIGSRGQLLDCVVFGGAVRVAGYFSSSVDDGLVHTEELAIDAFASVATRLVQPCFPTRFELARGCKLRLQITAPRTSAEFAQPSPPLRD